MYLKGMGLSKLAVRRMEEAQYCRTCTTWKFVSYQGLRGE